MDDKEKKMRALIHEIFGLCANGIDAVKNPEAMKSDTYSRDGVASIISTIAVMMLDIPEFKELFPDMYENYKPKEGQDEQEEIRD